MSADDTSAFVGRGYANADDLVGCTLWLLWQCIRLPLFMMLAILAVAAPMTSIAADGKSEEDHWIRDANGCAVFDEVPTPGESVTWSGRCEHGLAQGRGVLQWFENRAKGNLFEGVLVDGKAQGRGTFVFANRDRYEGDFKEGEFNGRGTFVFANRDRYEGDFKEGKRDGYGTQISVTGARYEGGYRNGVFNGHGVALDAAGNRYDGEYVDGKQNGHGVMTSATGERYDGQWQDNEFNGAGVYVYANGDRIEGQWRHGEIVGGGTISFANGDRYQGGFKDHKPDGRGTLLYATGGRYDGNFHEGKMDGHGVYVSASGRRYEGEFRNGKPASAGAQAAAVPSSDASMTGSEQGPAASSSAASPTAPNKVAQPGPAQDVVAPEGGCPTTLSYLADRLPRYHDSQLEQLRTAILQWNVAQSLQEARTRGATPAQAAASALDLAERTKSQLPRAEECIRKLSTEPDHTMAALQNGTFVFSDAPMNAVQACAHSYVGSYYMVVATKEAAIVAACLSNTKP
jgi:hypothetical protein